MNGAINIRLCIFVTIHHSLEVPDDQFRGHSQFHRVCPVMARSKLSIMHKSDEGASGIVVQFCLACWHVGIEGAVTLNEEEKQNREDDVVYWREWKRRRLFSARVVGFFGVSTICCFWWGSYFSCVGGFANKRESRSYDSVYDLRREETTENTLNIMFFGENVSVPLYLCMLSFVEIRHRLYFQYREHRNLF